MKTESVSKNSSASGTSPHWCSDLLENRTLNLFYLSKEAVIAYAKTGGSLNRRKLAEEASEILAAFIGNDFQDAEKDFIASIIERDARVPSMTPMSNLRLTSNLRILNPTGFSLLEIQDTVDIKLLKQLYKRAARKHHPDLGGLKSDMQRLNEAYCMFFEVVNNSSYSVEIEESNVFSGMHEGLDDWFFSIHLVLACIYGDCFAADKALEHLQKAHSFLERSNSPRISQFISHFLYGGIERPSGSLARFGMVKELSISAEITSALVTRYVKDWRPKFPNDVCPPIDRILDEHALRSQLGTKITITHPEQAKNAYRMGKIDKDRFDSSMERWGLRSDENLGMIYQINSFIDSTGFTPRINASGLERRLPQLKFVPYPQFNQDRFDFLWDEQKWEYIKVFSMKKTGHLFPKYYKIRIQEILLRIIKNYEVGDVEEFKLEIAFFLSNFGRTFSEYKLIRDLIEHLEKLPSERRDQKLLLLAEIDDLEQPTVGFGFSFDIRVENQSYKKRIQLDLDYIEFCMMDIERIRIFKQTGEIVDGFPTAWIRDMRSLQKFERSGLSRARRKIWLSDGVAAPEDVIKTSVPYLEGLLKLGRTFYPKNTGQLQIGYEINRVTIAFAKLKDWQKVIFWSELFFNLDSHFRDRSSESELVSVRRRLEKAEKQFKKIDVGSVSSCTPYKSTP